MSEPAFNSKLTEEEIAEKFKGIDVFSGIMDGLEEALAYEKENANSNCQMTDTIVNTKRGS